MRKTPRGDDRPRPRRLDFEQKLCDAIRARAVVSLRYEGDMAAREIEPYGIYESGTGKVNLVSTQIRNPGKPLDRFEPRVFEVGKIQSVVITSVTFKPDSRFDRTDARYSNGFLCVIDRV